MSVHISNRLLSNRNLVIICVATLLVGFVFANLLILYFPKDNRINLNGLSNITIETPSRATKNQISTTDLSLYNIATAVAKGGVTIIYTASSDKLNQDFEDTSTAFESVYSSKALITSGQDTWIERKKNQLGSLQILDLSKTIQLRPVRPAIDLGSGNQQTDQINSSNQDSDFNYVMNQNNLKIVIDNIANFLIKIDPSNTDIYSKNQTEMSIQITNLENQYSTILICDKTPIMAVASNLSYLVDKYQLDLTTFGGLDLTNLEPNQIKYLQDFAKSKNITSLVIDKKIPLIDYNNLKKSLVVEVYYISEYIYADVIDTLSKNLENLTKTQRCN